MRNKISFWTILLSLFFNVSLSFSQESLYIYRNDEQMMSAFFYSDIDSITYSMYDEEGVRYDDYITQMIYTSDSVYMIPLSVIDSVVFARPTTIFQPNAYELNSEYKAYLKSVDSLTLTFQPSLPSHLKPSKGDVLYNFDYKTPFENGFLGSVKTVSSNSDGIVVDCDLADITDVYKQYINHQQVTFTESDLRAASVDKDENVEYITKEFDINISSDIGGNGFVSSVGKFTYQSKIRTIIFVLNGEKQICSQSFDNFDIGFDFGIGLETKTDDSFLDIPIFTSITIPIGPAQLFFQPFFYIEPKASASIHTNVAYSLKSYHEWGTINGEAYDGKHTVETDSGWEPSGEFSLDGSIAIGIREEIGIGFPMSSFGVGFAVKCAPELSANIPAIPPSTPGTNDTRLYETFKDANLSLNAFAEFVPYVIVLGKKTWKYGSFNPNDSRDISFSMRRPLYSAYLFPEFKNLSANVLQDGKMEISSTLSRDVLLMEDVGYAVYDNDGLVDKVYSPYAYFRGSTSFKNPMVLSAGPVSYNTPYTIFPIIKLWDKEFLATPYLEVNNELDVLTDNVTNITENSAVCHGRIEPASAAQGIVCGICYGLNPDLSVENGECFSSEADADGEFEVRLSGLTDSTRYYYRAYAQFNDRYYYGDVKEFQTLKTEESDDTGEEPDPGVTPGEAVDLGLSVLWASYNVGATSPFEPGGLYGWGDPTGTHIEQGWASGGPNYIADPEEWMAIYGGVDAPDNISGTSLDIAHIQWGGDWRMPTAEEFEELYTKCKFELLPLNGIRGLKFTGPNGNSIFLPVTGHRQAGIISRDRAYYWTSNLHEDSKQYGKVFTRNGPYFEFHGLGRFNGCAVRPVKNK